jgi:hypothetical protein
VLAEGFVLTLGGLLDLGIVAVWAGDVAVFVLIAMRAAAPKALEGAVLGWIVWGHIAWRGALITLILGKGTLRLAWVSPNNKHCRRICGRNARKQCKHVEALPGNASGDVLNLMNFVLHLLGSS